MMRQPWIIALLAGVVAPSPVGAQDWNTTGVIALVDRAVQRRAGTVREGGLHDYRAAARGFVLFLTQLGAGFEEPPVLVKTDQLALEVLWQFPGRSKQRIIGWRDRMDLPTEIRYHRDHLGIVQNSFGDRIRLGDGHEVRDVLHPLSREGPAFYDFAAVDSVTITVETRSLRVVEVLVRPKVLAEPGVVGSVFLDVATGEIVRFRFGFTRAAYRDDTVEDITVALEHALWDGRYWLPREQQIEIRRRTGWLDIPARGIIRARWAIDDYEFNTGLSPTLFVGREIVPLPVVVRDTFPWSRDIDADRDSAVGSVRDLDLEAVRSELGGVVSRRLLSGLPRSGLGGGGISDLARFNRVEGVALGLGGVLRPGGGLVDVRGWGGYGLSDHRFKARGSVRVAVGAGAASLHARREIRDFADRPVVSPLLNSLGAQEGGADHGDYFLSEGMELETDWEWSRGGRGHGRLRVAAGVERVTSVDLTTTPAHGAFRPNPIFPEGTFSGIRLGLDVDRPVAGGRNGFRWRVATEAGRGRGRDFGRLAVAAHLRIPVPHGRLVARGFGGVGTAGLPAHRAFAIGGRGSLVGERFRRWGGRSVLWGAAEWQFAIPVPGLGFGSVVSTGERLILAPFAGVGWTGRPITGLPWGASDGARPVVGLAIEWLRGLVRWELGWSVRDQRIRGAFDVRRDLWGIL